MATVWQAAGRQFWATDLDRCTIQLSPLLNATSVPLHVVCTSSVASIYRQPSGILCTFMVEMCIAISFPWASNTTGRFLISFRVTTLRHVSHVQDDSQVVLEILDLKVFSLSCRVTGLVSTPYKVLICPLVESLYMPYPISLILLSPSKAIFYVYNFQGKRRIVLLPVCCSAIKLMAWI